MGERAPVAADLASLPQALARATGADWLLFKSQARESRPPSWIEVHGSPPVGAPASEAASRRLDFSLVGEVPEARLVRLSGASLARRPRFSGAGLRELLLYVQGQVRSPAVLAIGLTRPLRTDPGAVEELARALIEVDAMASRLSAQAETERQASLGRSAACAAHDLRHALTLAGLELERCAALEGAGRARGRSEGTTGRSGATTDWSEATIDRREATVPPSEAILSIDRAAAALAEARELCERFVAAGQLPSRRAPWNLAALLRGETLAASHLSGQGDGAAHARVEVRCPHDLRVDLDPSTLRRLVRNLLLNAIEASPDGAGVEVEARAESGELTIAVHDRGRGMSRGQLADLQRFGRSGRGGNGIGSASARSCAEDLGGTLEVESELFAGTTARLRLRLGPQPGRRAAGGS